MTIGDRIRKLREACGLTQEELATHVNTTKQTIHKYETGVVVNIPCSRVEAIACCLRVSPAFLFGWDSVAGASRNAESSKSPAVKLLNLASVDALNIAARYDALDDDGKALVRAELVRVEDSGRSGKPSFYVVKAAARNAANTGITVEVYTAEEYAELIKWAESLPDTDDV